MSGKILIDKPHFPIECEHCNWFGSSRECLDYRDEDGTCYFGCPKCEKVMRVHKVSPENVSKFVFLGDAPTETLSIKLNIDASEARQALGEVIQDVERLNSLMPVVGAPEARQALGEVIQDVERLNSLMPVVGAPGARGQVGQGVADAQPASASEPSKE